MIYSIFNIAVWAVLLGGLVYLTIDCLRDFGLLR